jgi:rubredoxin
MGFGKVKYLKPYEFDFLRFHQLKEVFLMANWKCSNCSYALEADTPPDECPSCKEKCEFVDNTCYTPDCEFEGTDKRI